jgi:hypothetical protein
MDVYPGEYDASSLTRHNITWYFRPGAIVYASGTLFGSDPAPVADPVFFNVTGFGRFLNRPGINAPIVDIGGATSYDLYIQCIDMETNDARCVRLDSNDSVSGNYSIIATGHIGRNLVGGNPLDSNSATVVLRNGSGVGQSLVDIARLLNNGAGPCISLNRADNDEWNVKIGTMSTTGPTAIVNRGGGTTVIVSVQSIFVNGTLFSDSIAGDNMPTAVVSARAGEITVNVANIVISGGQSGRLAVADAATIRVNTTELLVTDSAAAPVDIPICQAGIVSSGTVIVNCVDAGLPNNRSLSGILAGKLEIIVLNLRFGANAYLISNSGAGNINALVTISDLSGGDRLLNIDNTNAASQVNLSIADGGIDANETLTPCILRLTDGHGLLNFGSFTFGQTNNIMDLEARGSARIGVEGKQLNLTRPNNRGLNLSGTGVINLNISGLVSAGAGIVIGGTPTVIANINNLVCSNRCIDVSSAGAIAIRGNIFRSSTTEAIRLLSNGPYRFNIDLCSTVDDNSPVVLMNGTSTTDFDDITFAYGKYNSTTSTSSTFEILNPLGVSTTGPAFDTITVVSTASSIQSNVATPIRIYKAISNVALGGMVTNTIAFIGYFMDATIT